MSNELWRKSMTYNIYKFTKEGLYDPKVWPDWMHDFFIRNAKKKSSFLVLEDGSYVLESPPKESVKLVVGSVLVLRKKGERVCFAYPPEVFARDYEKVS